MTSNLRPAAGAYLRRSPSTPSVLGLMEGAGVPVIDLRLKFGLPETPITKDTSIIVMEVESQDGPVIVGALADAVHEVVDIEEKAIEPAPRFGTRLAAEFIRGVGKKDDLFIILLDIDRIFNAEEISVLTAGKEESEAAVTA